MGRLTSLPSAVITDDSALGGAVIEKSLRFNSGDGSNLSRTPSSAGNRKTWTWSAWIRRATIGSRQILFSADDNATQATYFMLELQADDNLRCLAGSEGGSATCVKETSMVIRDTNSWYHLVFKFDATNSLAVWYVNGQEITDLNSSTNPSNQNFQVNATSQHFLGRFGSSLGTSYFNGYMAEINFIDGFALDASYFGYTEFQTGIWRPKGYFGSYGTNGFRLDFSDSSGTTALTLGKDRSGQGNDFTPNNFIVDAEIVTNGEFNSGDSNWTKDSSWSIANGKASNSGGGEIYQTIAVVSGVTYVMTGTVDITADSSVGNTTIGFRNTANSQYYAAGGTGYTTFTANAVNQLYVKWTSNVTGNVRVRCYSSDTISIDNWSVKAIGDNFLESPTAKKEFATFNSNLQTSSSTEYRQGNLAFYTSGSSTVQTRANMSRSSGKWYAEFTLTTYTHRSGSYPYVGVAQAENFSNTWTGQSGTAYQSQGGIWRNSNTLETGYATYAAGDVISVAINLDSSPPQVWWAKNGSYIRSGANPSTLTAGINIEPASTSGTYTFTASLYANPGQWDANFGQRPFAHSVPTGFKTLNTDNFSINTPTIIRPQKHFGAIVYTPNSGGLTVTGLEFKPDLVWAKSRTQLYRHYLWDSVRGTGKRALSSNETHAQGNDTTTIDAFVEGGFTLPGASGINDNGSGTNGVAAWCWKGGKPIVSTSGSINTDGTTDYLTVAGHSDLDFGTGNFTIEGYFNTEKNTNSTIICSNNYYTAGTDGNWLFRITNSTQVAFASYDGTGNAEYSEFSFTVKRGKWHHFALVREGTGSNQFKIYIDGNSVGAMTVSKSLSGGTTGVGIGEDLSGTNHEFKGNISNIRIIKGTALYTSNFTVPTSPLTNVTNTKLLCCQSAISATAAAVSPTSITASGQTRSEEKNPFDAFSVDGIGYASASAAGITEGNLAITGASINKEAGFSIVTFDANNNASATIGHGLNSKPEFVVVKDASNSDDWQCKFINDNMYVAFNNNNAGSTSYGNYTATDTLINLGYTWNNGSGIHVVYSWTSIPGFSKIGKYNALGSTDGAYVELGFRPAFIIIRPTNNFGGSDQNYSTWGLFDSTRGPTNPVTYAAMLTANKNNVQQVRGNGSNDGALAAFDILGTGFKVRNSAYEVGYSGSYFYMAFAEQAGESPYHTDTNAR